MNFTDKELNELFEGVFNGTIDIYNLDEFIKTLKFQLHKNQVLEQNEEEKMLFKFLESIRKKQELETEQIAKNLEDKKEFKH